MTFKPYCPTCKTWHTDVEGHLTMQTREDFLTNRLAQRGEEMERLREIISEAVEFYDRIDRPHAEGEAALLDRMATAVRGGQQ